MAILTKPQQRIIVEVPNPALRSTLVQRHLFDRTDLMLGLLAVLVAVLLLVNLSLLHPVNGAPDPQQPTPSMDGEYGGASGGGDGSGY